MRRKLLAIITVGLAAALVTTLLSLVVGVGDKMAGEMKSYGSNIRVVPRSDTINLNVGGVEYNPLEGRDYLEEDQLSTIKEIFWSNNIVGITPFLKVPVFLEGATSHQSNAPYKLNFIGTYFDHVIPIEADASYRSGAKITHKYWRIKGAWPLDDKTDQVLIGEALARAIKANIGDKLALIIDNPSLSSAEKQKNAATLVTVSGIVSTGEAEDDAIIGSLAMAQQLSGLQGKVQSISVSALTIPENELSMKALKDEDSLSPKEYDTWYCSAFVSAIVHQIEEAMPNASAKAVWQVTSGEGAVIQKLQTLLLVITCAAFISASLGISSLMNTTIMERAKEIGLLKALGASNWKVYSIFWSEALIIGAVGGLLGLLLGAGMAYEVGRMAFSSPLILEPIILPLVVVLSILTALIGVILPTRAIASLQPVEVLYGR
ncbi:ABC transporter permease [Polycladidibacter stylochi]|uniref:ABC transporter permease n=1 Tax=Polycladidibacter stylochi TaxID=1807766 RepID=UPI0019D384EB|nr:FtsX-like permease family protein [Pseudovibrio stylochi]